MRRKSIAILALVLVFALVFTACVPARRPLQTPAQQRQNTTGMYNNNRYTGVGTGTTTGTRTGVGAGNYTPYDVGYGYGNNGIGYGGYGNYNYNNGLYGGYGTANNTGYGNYNFTNGNFGGNIGYGGYGYDYRNAGGTNNSSNFGLNNAGGPTEANSLERSLEQMTGVRDATVVVNGNTAYVGIDTDRTTGTNVSYGNATDVTAIKRACAQRVRTSDPNIRTVYVSTDADFSDRLRRVGDGIRNGTPISTFRNELNTLIRGITPDRQ